MIRLHDPDSQTLLAVFAAFYLMECVWIVPAQAWLAVGRDRVSRFVRPWDRFHIAGALPVLLHPLPSPQVPAMPWILVAEASHLVLHRDDGTRESLDWSQIEPKASEKTLRLDGRHTLRLPHADDAAAWSALVTAWKALRPEQRRAAFLKHARQTRIIIFDSPPLLLTTESRVLATHMRQVVMVVQAERTLQSDVKQALAAIEACPVVCWS